MYYNRPNCWGHNLRLKQIHDAGQVYAIIQG